MSPDDPRFPRVGELQAEINNTLGTYFFAGWLIHRKYTPSELEAAAALKLSFRSTFEPSGEECGTVYDESVACPNCGAGARQENDLHLDLRKAPKTKDLARTIAGENIVSQRLAERVMDAGLKGFELRRVRHKARYEDDPLEFTDVPAGRRLLLKAEAENIKFPEWEFWVWVNKAENRSLVDQAHEQYAALKRRSARAKGNPASVWYQLVVRSQVDIMLPTLTGIKPFNEDLNGECRCPRGDTIGLNLLSELSISKQEFGSAAADIVETRQYIGTRRGLLRPERRLVISPRFWHELVAIDAKGYTIEVAHLR